MNRRIAVGLAVLTLVMLTGCGSAQSADPPASTAPATTSSSSTSVTSDPPSAVASTSARPSSTAPSTSTGAGDCPYPKSGFDCDFQRRFAKAEAYVKGRPGYVGIVVRDRKTGAVWRNAHAGDMVWTASTIKLAMTVDLFLRDAAGKITLTSSDRSLIQRMLHSSDDEAADSLWFKYAGADHMTFNNDFPNYGMTSLQPQKGFSNFYPYWGFQKCTADDLDRLINYVLAKLPSSMRDYIVHELSNVDPDQQWGVWGAGQAAAPGNKDGWSKEQGGWVMNTVGFVGPGQRYTLAVMNSLRGQGGYDEGRETDSQLAKILFGGKF